MAVPISDEIIRRQLCVTLSSDSPRDEECVSAQKQSTTDGLHEEEIHRFLFQTPILSRPARDGTSGQAISRLVARPGVGDQISVPSSSSTRLFASSTSVYRRRIPQFKFFVGTISPYQSMLCKHFAVRFRFGPRKEFSKQRLNGH